MKRSDLETLKKMLDGTEYEVLNESPDDNDRFFVVKKKDSWDGVEFVEHRVNGVIHKIKGDWDNWEITAKAFYEPSTEEAYIEQLKKEAFERFGEIKEGDRVKRDHISVNWGKDNPLQKTLAGYFDFSYHKPDDTLYKGNLAIYKQGKWAERVKERITVKFLDHVIHNKFNRFDFSISEEIYKSKNLNSFLKEQLENYLNKETEKK